MFKHTFGIQSNNVSAFLVSARKYRPIRWEDVVGQEHLARTLKNALKQNQVAHAFLFCGPRGVGKTTCARILAKVLNCERPTADWEPCNECSMCQAFADNNSFNIFELDAASNNSVEDIRQLVEQVRYQPQYGKFKIYIVDEVHMLSSAAFNAFLKTLEEPPPYAKFILATTEKHKILPTILSRCQVYDFRRIQEKDIVGQLQKICTKENISADDEALHLIAQKADGALRDALSIFDRIASFAGNTISYQDALENLNVLDQDYYFKFVDAFLLENHSGIFKMFDEILRNGFESDVFLEGLGNHFRSLFVCKDPEMSNLFESSSFWKEKYILQSQACSFSFITSALDLIADTDIHLGKARNKRLHMEILLTRLCFMKHRIQQSLLPETLKEEKKKPELSSDSSLVQNRTPQVTLSEQAQAAPKERMSIPYSPNINRGISSIPKIQSLDSLKQKVTEDHRLKKENLLEWNQENALQFWNQFKERQNSASLKFYMNQAKVEIGVLEMNVFVASIIAKEAIRKELDWERELRSTFKEEKIKFTVEIASELAERDRSKVKKFLSAKEKWELLVQVNPALQEFKDKLELKMDED
ncbi:MAG: DNA polymerase III subunit gamma/tau [Bacteroidota bacterium]|nr:DNA polymerase III subunit gamma/tau [Bacteroidota bacterium]